MDTAQQLEAFFAQTRAATEALAAPLTEADLQVQSMPDASPGKWHLAHSTWFFEELVLRHFEPGFAPFDPGFGALFNSYYEGLGARHPRAARGVLSRPGLGRVLAWRSEVTARVRALLTLGASRELLELVTLGCHHEQQHQELFLTDLLHAFWQNPLGPAVLPPLPRQPARAAAPLQHLRFEGGVVHLGHAGAGFCFDNETPRHRVFLEPYLLSHRPVTHGEFRAFVEEGGYRTPGLWLSEGWALVQAQGWNHPLYWRAHDGLWEQFTLRGWQPLEEHAPVCQLSYFEADAYARWAKSRLPTEAEWEHAAQALPVAGNFLESGLLQPRVGEGAGLQLFGDVWEWTSSGYLPYPGFTPWAGAVGEYNGKFMVNQQVLRGGSCVSPRSHLRASYRNFFPPSARWQFSGLRLAKSA